MFSVSTPIKRTEVMSRFITVIVLAKMNASDANVFQVILAGMLTGVQGEIQCKVLAALYTVK